MRKIFTLLFCTISILNICFAQQKDSTKIDSLKVKVDEDENKPLFVVDGIPLEFSNSESKFMNIDPNSIASMNVVNPPISVYIYGKAGLNGVIFVYTKSLSKRKLRKLIELQSKKNQPLDDGQLFEYSGIIKDCENIPIQNAKITNLNLKSSVQSDSSGKFKINANKNHVLQISLFRFETKRLITEDQRELIVKLKVLKINSNNNSGNIILKKPVIYLYPEKETAIDFKFDFVGKVLTTFPKYDNNWSVIAYPDGKIFDNKTKRFYNSLFWDGDFTFAKSHYDYKDGFVVSKNNLTKFLIEKLEFMGLSNSETNEFVQFWLPIMEKNQTNLIHFWQNENYDVFSKNTITPKPETSLRIFMEFSAVDDNFKIQEQQLFKTKRKGFTLVEWGGSDVSSVFRNNL